MKTDSRSSQLFILSERVYRTLLVLYPADFRRAYGPQMAQVFRDVCRDTYCQGGTAGLVNWWAAALFDLLATVIAERRKVGFTVSQAKFIQWSGWLCIFGGIFLLASSIGQLNSVSGFGAVSLYALVPGMALIMLGLFGILLRYNAHLNLFGKSSLLLTLAGAGVTSVGLLLTLTAHYVNGYNLFIAGWLVQVAGHSVFGGFVMTTHLLPKWNFALLIGSALPITVIVLVLSNQQATSGWAASAMLLVIGISWLLTGWALNSQSTATTQLTRA
jgi:hypothetical protein